jgi:DNA-binding NarL/FixJ family response regulator
MKPPIRVLIISADPSFPSWHTALEGILDIALVGQVRDYAHAADWLAGTNPDVIVWDAEAVALIESQSVASLAGSHTGRVLLLCAPKDEYLMLELLRQGAWGYKLKNERLPDEIADAIRTLYKGGAVVGSQLAGRMLDQLSGHTEPETSEPN